MPASSASDLRDGLWDDGDPKSEAAALGLLDMTGVVRLPDVGGVNIGGSIADAVEGVCSDDDEDMVPPDASLDIGSLCAMVVEGDCENHDAAAWWKAIDREP